ncbi:MULTISPECIES: hypothetical protein [Pseudoalteromonas]|uniref:Uncharacterized protein n=1 Tax=Pseudoalteromonas amylolytica TaxID=1859457 RepID=A0A1S1MP47_9GAMM|nr:MULTISPECIES: hypothetical protein [Pseudoalteromonas]OHU85128.1 hypothetical protein BFC16_20870 [Pseudoalteromonas sp. JW3]OHU89921.1 hypothetical protein BET10_14105 [Pseudoalteromonas amylolytica]
MEFRTVQEKMLETKKPAFAGFITNGNQGGNQQMLIATNKHNYRLPTLRFSSKLNSNFIN